MFTLNLILSQRPTEYKNFTIFAVDYGEEYVDYVQEDSELPFSKNQENSHLYTVLNALNSLDGKYKFNSDDDQYWMVAEGLLDAEDKTNLHPKMHENIGKKLYEALFRGEIKQALVKKLELASRSKEDLHIQIQYDAKSSTLSLYPWNLAHDGNNFIAKNRVTFSYKIANSNIHKSEKRRLNQFKVLVISSTATEENQDKLHNKESLIKYSLEKGRACLLSWYEPKTEKPTFKRLVKYLNDYQNEKNKIPDIIHFDGHGLFKKRCNTPLCSKSKKNFYSSSQKRCDCCGRLLSDPEGFLLFEDNEGEPDYICGEKLTNLVKRSEPKLLVITACKSALAHKSNTVFNGVAQKLLQEVPAVVATPFTISQDSATNFIEEFYRVLGNGKSSLLEAVKQASETMEYHNHEWYRPVIFLQQNDGYLFEFQETPPNYSKVDNGGVKISPKESEQTIKTQEIRLSKPIKFDAVDLRNSSTELVKCIDYLFLQDDLETLKDLIFCMEGINYKTLNGETPEEKVKALIAYLHERNDIESLIEGIVKFKPEFFP